MAKWHLVLATEAVRPMVRERLAGRAICGRRTPEAAVFSAEEFRGRISSGRCKACERKLAELIGSPDPRREDCCAFHRNGGLLDAKCR